MILFKPEHVAPILAGAKTQTRRIWKKCRVNSGSIHLAKTKMISKEYFAKLEILKIKQEKLGQISERDAKREGYPSRIAFLIAFANINYKCDPSIQNEDDLRELDNEIDFMGQMVYVVSFKLLAGASMSAKREAEKKEAMGHLVYFQEMLAAQEQARNRMENNIKICRKNIKVWQSRIAKLEARGGA